MGHGKDECPDLVGSTSEPAKPRGGECFTCGSPDHWSSACPHKKAGTVSVVNPGKRLRSDEDEYPEVKTDGLWEPDITTSLRTAAASRDAGSARNIAAHTNEVVAKLQEDVLELKARVQQVESNAAEQKQEYRRICTELVEAHKVMQVQIVKLRRMEKGKDKAESEDEEYPLTQKD